MRLAAAVLTRNQYEHERRDLFEQTVESLVSAGVDLYIIDNGSTDGTDKLVQSTGEWTSYLSTAGNTTSGFGTWTCCRVLAATDADLCIVSDDDMVWSAGFTAPLVDWWEHAPADLMLTGGHLEPEFFWNAITERAVFGNTHGLIRDSTGAASWTFLHKRWPTLKRVYDDAPAPIRNCAQQGVWDVPMCEQIRSIGWRIGQLDLAEHVGQGRSSWGNRSAAMYGWDVESVRATI